MFFQDITDTFFEGVSISNHPEFNHEKVFYYEDNDVGLKSIVAIHDSTKGPAIGGCRFREYSSFECGLNDVLRLSRGMTEKNNVAQIPFGGGKAIIFADKTKSDELLKSYANFLNLLEGKYISAEDIGISLNDIKYIKKYTDHVFDNVDPGPYTAKGIFYSIEAAINFYFNETLDDKKIAIQGAGSVGLKLANHLADAGAKVYIQDIDKSKLKRIVNDNIIPVEDAFIHECHVFAPCAIGAIFTNDSIRQLNCKVIAGGANNQLQQDSIADDLQQLGIAYVPDVLINSGGVIGLTKDLLQRDENQTEIELQKIANRAIDLMSIAKKESISVLSAMRKSGL